MRRLISLLLVSLILGGTWFSDASGRTWVASPDGTQGDGLLPSILDQVEEGDTVKLLAGVHDWAGGLLGVSLRIQGEDGAIIRGGAVGSRDANWFEFINIDFAETGNLSGIDLGRFLLKGCEYRDRPATASALRVDSVIVEGSKFLDNDRMGSNSPAGLWVTSSGSIKVEDCLFSGNKCLAGGPINTRGQGGGGLSIEFCETAVIRGNVFRDNQALAGSGLYFQGRTIVLENNTFFENNCETAAAVIRTYGERNEDAVIRQNIFANSNGYGLWMPLDSTWYPRVYCNAFWENNDIFDLCSRDEGQWWSCSTLQYGYEDFGDFYSVIADPMFCDDENLGVSPASDLANPPGKPCAPIGGASGIGCINPVVGTSWGSVKKLFYGRASPTGPETR